MIMSVSEVENYFDLGNVDDEVVTAKLQSIEMMIRQYTNNNFQSRNYRTYGNVKNGVIEANTDLFRAGDTIEISRSLYNDGLYVIDSVENGQLKINGSFIPEEKVLVTKIIYPADIKVGAINLLKWDLENRDKVGIKSESISRHSVTYFDMDANNLNGYPASLLGFLKPYRKARF